jgi:plasmid stabilization system protein ParE
MRKVSLVEEAAEEGEEAASWYESQRNGLGREFREALAQSIDNLRNNYVSGTIWPGLLGERGVRRIRMGRFPYHVVFIGDDQKTIVLAIAHQRRRPGYWRRRIK